MARHSFIQIEKIKNVKGRIHYISSYVKQENLYATMDTANTKFWRDLSKESQQEFLKSGAKGTCIEARELIIALPEAYTEYDPQKVLELFTNSFHETHNVECISALHHNRKKTNYHIHLIFSERRLLDKPEIKIASRNMFYNEKRKRVRTKKEILNQDGNIRDGCKITAKGEIYEQRKFTNKEMYFKGEKFLEDEKKRYTELINCYIKNPEERLKVFEKNNIYLPTKKIGKNNPKAKEIQEDNDIRNQWNRTVDVALIEGVPEAEIMEVKKKEISRKVQKSIRDYGKKPGLFQRIVLLAKEVLETIIQKFKLPPKPQLTVDIREFREMEAIYTKLAQQSKAIQGVEQQELPELKYKLSQLGGILKKKERKVVEKEIGNAETRMTNMKKYLDVILSKSGYNTVQDFMQVYRKSESLVLQYQRDFQKWEEQADEIPPRKESISVQLRKYQNQIGDEEWETIKKKGRSAR